MAHERMEPTMLTTNIEELKAKLELLTHRYNTIMAAIKIDPSLKGQYSQELQDIDRQVERITNLIGLL